MGWMIELPRRGQIWLVNLNPAVGSEIRKTRPALIISNDSNNEYADLVTVLPITDRGLKSYPFEVLAPLDCGLTKPSKIKCQQIRTVDKRRLTKLLGAVHSDLMDPIEHALRIHLGFGL